MVHDKNKSSKEIYCFLKESIIEGKIKDGDFLTLSEIASKFSVSKMPVRDALGALVMEGYLKSIPRRGYFVNPITQNHIREYFQMRLVLETSAAEIVTRVASEQELSNIVTIAQSFPNDLNEGSMVLFNRLNTSFHMSIVKSTRNDVMVGMYSSVIENLYRILAADSRVLNFSYERDEHIKIGEALFNRDAKSAVSLTSNHVIALQNRFYGRQKNI